MEEEINCLGWKKRKNMGQRLTELNQKKSKIKVKTKEEKTCSREGEKEESMQRVPSAIKTFDI